ncbi:MAG: hypothetical protein ACM358_04215 [Gemmatimonadota bacterium]
MGRRAFAFLSVLCFTVIAAGCEDGTAPGGIVVKGRIQNNTDAVIPANARLVVVWGVSSGTPDYGYVFGAGTIHRFNGTFSVRLDQPPPSAALNAYGLGVGFIIVTTDPLTDGDSITNSSQMTGVLGLTGQHALIFVADTNSAQALDWAAEFDLGYSVGVGVKVPGEIFDKFVPASRSSPVLIIDDPANIEVVNWTSPRAVPQ